MGLLKDLFNDIVDIAAFPLKVAGKLADDVMESEIEDYIDEVKETIKGEK